MRRLRLVLPLVLLAAGCAVYKPDPNGLFRCQRALRPERPRAHADEPPIPGRPAVRVVRYTDGGEYVDRCEVTDAYQALLNPGSQIVVVYVHGWKHNAEGNDRDLRAFERLVGALDRAETARVARGQRRAARRVVGIYVAWDAKRLDYWAVRNLTFWSRMGAADQLTRSASITKLIGALESIRRQRADPDDIVILAGHSFGARVLYSATSQVLLHRVQQAHPGRVRESGEYARVEGVADLVLLVNPAFESILFSAFHTIRRDEERFSSAQLPLLMAVSSEGDRATRYAFPVGKWLSGKWSPKFRTTLGNLREYQTHALRVARAPADSAAAAGREGASWFDSYCERGVCLERHAGASIHPHNPFIVARAEKAIIGSHNDIWNETFVQWVAAFIGELDYRRRG